MVSVRPSDLPNNLRKVADAAVAVRCLEDPMDLCEIYPAKREYDHREGDKND
jgi:hypothetical protein